MSLSQKIAAEVANALGAADQDITLHAEQGAHILDVPLILATPMGIECRALQFFIANHPMMDLNDLKAWGDRIAAKVTYLMEPLSFIEADAQQGQVLLRSGKPTPKNNRRTYYEVRLYKAGSLNLVRVAFDDTTKTRQDIPCQFTMEVLERLTDDLVTTAA